MTEKFLNASQVSPAIEKICSKRVAKTVRTEGVIKSTLANELFEAFSYGIGGEAPSSNGEKQGIDGSVSCAR